MDRNRVNAAVKISLALVKSKGTKFKKLYADLERLKDQMTVEEFTEYQKRVN